MMLTRFLYGALVGLLAIPPLAKAGPVLQLDATSVSVNASNFSLQFNDANSNQLLDIGEITSFTGVTYFGNGYTQILQVPNINGISVWNRENFCAFGPAQWCFSVAGRLPTVSVSAQASDWTYALSTVGAPLPEPASLALVSLALAAAGFAARRRTPK